MKKILTLFLAVVITTLFSNVYAYMVNGINYSINSDGVSVYVTSKSGGYFGAVNIPSTVRFKKSSNSEEKTYRVTGIGGSAFYGCTGLTLVNIPNSVTSIGTYAFYGCTGLTSIDVNSGNTKYDSRNNCNAIIETATNTLITGCKNTTIPNSVTSIGSSAFYGCTGLTSVTIPNSVTTIGDLAFSDCTGLTSVTIPNSVTSIGYGAFSDCTSLTSVTIDSNIILNNGIYIFGSQVEKCIIGNSVTSIGYGAFSDCTGLTLVTIGSSVTSIGTYAFYGCTGLTYIEVNSGNTKYDSRNNCNAIIETATNTLITGCKNTTIPNSVTSIGSSAFNGCIGLTSVTIPNSVTSIGSSAFNGCTGLTSVYISDLAAWCNIDFDIDIYSRDPWETDCYSSNPLYYAENLYLNGVKVTNLVIPNSVTKIKNFTFSGYKGFSLTIPSSLKEIGVFAFSENPNLTTVIWNARKAIVVDGDGWTICVPFGHKSIKNIIFGNTVERIPLYLCYGCKGLTSVIIPNSVTEIGYGAFEDCTGLASVTIGNSVREIGGCAFNGCIGLTSVTIPNSVTEIGYGAFEDCTGLRDLYCKVANPSDVYMEDGVFYNVPKDLCTLHVPDGSIEPYSNADQWKDFYIVEEIEIQKYYESGFGSKNEWNQNCDTAPQGVTADGASQLLMCIDRDVLESNSVTFEIVTKVNGEKTSNEEFVGEISQVFVQSIDNEDKYCFIYTAPSDFVYNTSSSCYTVEISICMYNNESKVCNASTTVEVYRPSVLLLHGLLSDKTCFDGLEIHLHASGYYDFLTLNGEYVETNATSFENNTFVYDVVGSRLNKLFAQLAHNGIVSSKYDLVGHSMGGILSRMYAQEVKPEAVNRIITLDTPHSGSQLANLRSKVLTSLGVISVLPTSGSPIIKNAYTILNNLTSGNGNLAALENLAPGSNAIARLNGVQLNNAVGIPVHSICSVMTPPQNNDTCSNNQVEVQRMSSKGLQAINDFLFNNIKSNSYERLNDFYGGLNDGVVSFVSQSGGLGGEHITVQQDAYNGYLGCKSNAHHINTNKWTTTYSNITSLLQSPKSSSQFSTQGFTPTTISNPQQSLSAENSPNYQFGDNVNTFVKLSVSKNVSDTTLLTVSVTQSQDIVRQMVYAVTDKDQMLCDVDKDMYEFIIPKDYRGRLQVYALGRTVNNVLVADVVEVDYTNGLIPGDVNGDGVVTAADVTALYDLLLNNDDSKIVNGDQTGDGQITAADVTAVYTVLLEN